MPMLVVFAGLPGSGKSTIARRLASITGAVWLRIDSIEQAIRDSGVVPGSLNDAGYRAAYAVAEDNLRLGRDVIGDSVNPWMLTRNACGTWACGPALRLSRSRLYARISTSTGAGLKPERATCQA
jgi:predicted kinase